MAVTKDGFWTVLLAFIILSSNYVTAQSNYYTIDWSRDAYILGGGVLLSGASFYLKDKADKATIEDIMSLNRDDVWAFDRGATDELSANAKTLSDYILFGSVALPVFLMTDKKAREEGLAIGLMAAEAIIINNGISNILKATTKRFRPFTYNSEVPLEEKLTRSARFSFVSGHASNVAAVSFLSAKVITDLHPDSKLKPLYWSLAATIPALTGYFRYKAGRHFPTDIIFGYGLGAAVGYFIPVIHKNEDLDVLIGDNGAFGLRYTF